MGVAQLNRISVLFFFAVTSPAALAQVDEIRELSDSKRTELVRHIEETMRKHQIPGLTVAIGLRGHLTWTRGFGLADLENKVKATEHTVYRLASISKPITAVAAMQLVERGKLSIDDIVQEHVASFPKKRWPLTSRHLLSHLGGVRHYRSGEINSTRHYRTVLEGLQIFAQDPLLHEPGSKYAYTSYGYNLLGAVVASAAGTSFEKVLTKNVFAPAGMTHARVDNLAAIIENRAQGYRRTRQGKLRNSHIVDTSNKIPAGGLVSTASDLVHFAHALLAGKLVKPATLEEMWRPAKTKAGESIRYGLGFSIVRAEKPRIVGHSGGQPRVATMLLIRPDERIVVAVMCNLERAPSRRLARSLSDRLASLSPGAKSARSRRRTP